VRLQSGWAWGQTSHNRIFNEVIKEKEGGEPTTERKRWVAERGNPIRRMKAECIPMEER
jgi:hypothetical protein